MLNPRRRAFITLLGGVAAAWPLLARAQQSAKTLQVGFLYPGPQAGIAPRLTPFTSGLQAGGLRVPDQVTVIPIATDGNAALLAPMAADLVARKVDALLVVAPAALRAAREATSSIPIVAIDLESDPTEAGFIASYARPGGNVTGVFLDFADFSKKWLEALKEAIPNISSVAVFWDPALGTTQIRAVEAAARVLDLKLVILEMRGRSDVESAFKSAAGQGVSALLILSSPFVSASTKLLADQALSHRLPAITLFPHFARDGGLMGYGPNFLGYFRHAGVMVAKILRGADPAETPIDRPAKFEFVLNLKTAALLGIVIPPAILLRADEVIE
jgi:putative ABC transport system substrate-binding protein